MWLVQTADGGWEPGIGDPTLMGWFTVFAYFGTALLCYRALRKAKRAGPGQHGLIMGWGALCIAMAALGLNKQLDLQSLITVVGRRLAHEQGWYERRHVFQVWFIEGLTAFAGIATVSTGWLMRKHLRRFWLALVGAGFIALFVVVRATSFHSVDLFLGSHWLGIKMNWVLELSGIACIALCAMRSRGGSPRKMDGAKLPKDRTR